MDGILDMELLGRSLGTIVIAVAVALGGIIVALIVRRVTVAFIRRAHRRRFAASDGPESEADGSPAERTFAEQSVRGFVAPSLMLAAIYGGVLVLGLEGRSDIVVGSILVVVFSLVVIRFVVALLNQLFTRIITSERTGDITRLRPLRSVASIIVWLVGLLFLLDNLGFNISAVVAGLGIGGIAIALAAQALLGDLFAYFVILFDRPFELGDFLIFGDILGSVEHIGVKTTRLRSLSGEQIIVANGDLTSSRLRNYTRMQERRVVFSIGVVYDTGSELLERIPGMIRETVEAETTARFDRAHFSSYGDWSLNFEVVYYVLSPDYALYMDIQQRINLAIYRRFEEAGISFAFPTRTIELQQSESSAETGGRTSAG